MLPDVAASDVAVDAGPPAVPMFITAGSTYTCARMSDGTVRCWGNDENGELGAGNVTLPAGQMGLAMPTVVTGVSSATTLALGYYTAGTLLTDGTTLAWGATNEGQITIAAPQATLPVPIEGISSGVALLAIGDNHTCAVMQDGTLRCRGDNSLGQLGQMNTMFVDSSSVSGLPAIDQIVAGTDNACVIMHAGGTVECWGGNDTNQSGAVSGQTCTNSAPCVLGATPIPGLSGVTQLSAGSNHMCALRSDQTVWCWGFNGAGQLGYTTTQACPVTPSGSTTATCSPIATQVPGLSGVLQIAAGYMHTCAALSVGSLECWGANDSGQLGYNSTQQCNAEGYMIGCTTVPTIVPSVMEVVQVTAGQFHTCVGELGGAVYCWGDNTYGQLGTGDFNRHTGPAHVIAPGFY